MGLVRLRDGKFLKVLVREEVRQDKDWVIRLRSLPGSPETYYLMELLASQDFQTALQNHLDLDDLRRKLASWDVNFDAFADMVGLRREYYEPQLPGVDAEFRDLDSRMRLRLEQHELLEKRLQGLLVAPRPEFLATADERLTATRLTELASGLEGDASPTAAALRERIARLRGVLTFTLRTEYDGRLNVFAAHLRTNRTVGVPYSDEMIANAVAHRDYRSTAAIQLRVTDASVELWNPGLIFPGTVGAISLILGLYGLQVLPVSLAGLFLMLLAAFFFVTEAFVPSHGALTLAGAITFVLEDMITNVFTFNYVALTNFLPPCLVASNSLITLGEVRIIQGQSGYSSHYDHLVYAHHVFFWRFGAGVVSLLLYRALHLCIRESRTSADAGYLAAFLVLVATGGLSHQVHGERAGFRARRAEQEPAEKGEPYHGADEAAEKDDAKRVDHHCVSTV